MRLLTNLLAVVLPVMVGCGGDGERETAPPPPPPPVVEAAVEEAPTLPLAALVEPELRSGVGFTLDDPVPTDGLMAHFTLRSDGDATEVIGVDLLRIRVAEVAALATLRSVSGTERFLDAVANAATRPIESATNIVKHPIDTVKGIPDGVSRFFGRVQHGAEQLRDRLAEEGGAPGERAAIVGKQAAGVTADAFGYEQERRRLAKQLGVDPYTTNPLLAKEMDHVAWVAFSGRLGITVLFSAVVPGSMALTLTNATNDLVWDTPRGDLVVANETKLRALDVPDDVVRALQANPAWSLTLQTALVRALERLGGATGRPAVVTLAAGADEEAQARFVTGTLELLAGYHETVAPIVGVTAQGTTVGRDREGTIVVPGAADHVAWTTRVRDFAHRPDLAGKQRSLRIRGDLSPAARQSFTALGWGIHERWTLPAAK